MIECDVLPLVWIQCQIRVLVSHGGRSQDEERIQASKGHLPPGGPAPSAGIKGVLGKWYCQVHSVPHLHTVLQGQDCAGPFTVQQRMEKVSLCHRRTNVIIPFRSVSHVAHATELNIKGDDPSSVLGCLQLNIACWPSTCMWPPGTYRQQGNLIGTHCVTTRDLERLRRAQCLIAKS